MQFFKIVAYEGHHCVVAYGPKELLKIHRIHKYFFLLRWNHYVFHIFFDGNKQSGLDIIIAAIFHYIFYSGTRSGIQLHLIKYNHRISRV